MRGGQHCHEGEVHVTSHVEPVAAHEEVSPLVQQQVLQQRKVLHQLVLHVHLKNKGSKLISGDGEIGGANWHDRKAIFEKENKCNV